MKLLRKPTKKRVKKRKEPVRNCLPGIEVRRRNEKEPPPLDAPVFTPRCVHSGTIPLFTYPSKVSAKSLGHSEFYAANMAGLDVSKVEASLILDCGNITQPVVADFVRGGEYFEQLNRHVVVTKCPAIVKLAWHDYGVPPAGVTLDFWRDMLNRLPSGRIVVCCVGGHGRTGTCLGALYIAANLCTGQEAIDFVRTHHCHKAIETNGQEQYLIALGNEVDRG